MIRVFRRLKRKLNKDYHRPTERHLYRISKALSSNEILNARLTSTIDIIRAGRVKGGKVWEEGEKL